MQSEYCPPSQYIDSTVCTGLTKVSSTLEKIGKYGADILYSGELGNPPPLPSLQYVT